MLKTLFSSAALLAAVSMHEANAHSMMTLPKPNSNINNSPSGTIDGPSAMPPPAGKGYGTSPEANTEAFLEAFKAQSKYKSIRDLVYANFKPDGASTKECGQSAATGPAQALPAAVEYGGGFDSSHLGPCEVWCDDTRVFYDDNCAKTYPQKPAKLPYDKSKCAGAKRLQSFWLALHVPAWQAYISCATIGGGGGGGGSDSAPAPAPAGNNNNGGGSSNSNGGGNSNNGGNNNNGGGNNNNGGGNNNNGGGNNNNGGGNNNNGGGNNNNGGGNNNNNNNNGGNKNNNGGNNNNNGGNKNTGGNNNNNGGNGQNNRNNGGNKNNGGNNNNNNGGNGQNNRNNGGNNWGNWGGNRNGGNNNGQRSYDFGSFGRRTLRAE